MIPSSTSERSNFHLALDEEPHPAQGTSLFDEALIFNLDDHQDQTFLKKLHHKALTNETATFWNDIYLNHARYKSYVAVYIDYLLCHYPDDLYLSERIEEALFPCFTIDFANMAEEMFRSVALAEFSTLIWTLQDHRIVPYLINEALEKHNKSYFSYLIRTILNQIEDMSPDLAAALVRQIYSHDKIAVIKGFIHHEWHQINDHGHKFLIPYCSLDFLINEMPRADYESLTVWLDALIFSTVGVARRSEVFRAFMEALPNRLSYYDFVYSYCRIPLSPVIPYFFTQISVEDLSEISQVHNPWTTPFFNNLSLLSDEEIASFLRMVLCDQERVNILLEEFQYDISDSGGNAGVCRFFEFMENIQNALTYQQEEGELIDLYRQQLCNFPQIVIAIAASQERYVPTLIQASPYLPEFTVALFCKCMSEEASYDLTNFLWRNSKYSHLKICLLNLPEESKTLVFNNMNVWFIKKDIEANDAASRFFDLSCDGGLNDPFMYLRIKSLCLTTLGIRREITGPLSFLIQSIPLPRDQNPLSLLSMRKIIKKAAFLNAIWTRQGVLKTVLAKEVEDDDDAEEIMPVPLLRSLTIGLLQRCEIDSFDELSKVGLRTEEDFKLLGLTSERLSKIEQLQIKLNKLCIAPSVELALAWEELISLSKTFTDDAAKEAEVNVKRLLSINESERPKLARLLQKVLEIEPGNTLGKELCYLSCPFDQVLEFLIHFVRENTFERRLYNYLTQPNLKDFWDRKRRNHVFSISALTRLNDKRIYKFFDLK